MHRRIKNLKIKNDDKVLKNSSTERVTLLLKNLEPKKRYVALN
jgi:hypothetical protein